MLYLLHSQAPALYDAYGSYAPTLYTLAALCFVSAMLLTRARQPVGPHPRADGPASQRETVRVRGPNGYRRGTPGTRHGRRIERSHITAFIRWLAKERGLQLEDSDALWDWSVTDVEGFWQAIWDHYGGISTTPHRAVLESRKMPGTAVVSRRARQLCRARARGHRAAERHSGSASLRTAQDHGTLVERARRQGAHTGHAVPQARREAGRSRRRVPAEHS